MRDHNKDIDYFKKTISIKQNGLSHVQSEFNDADDAEDRDELSDRLIMYHLDLIELLYSSNGSSNEIKNHLYRIFELLNHCQYEDSYVQCLWLLSISYVLDISPTAIEILKKRILENKYDDFVVSAILNKMFGDVPIKDSFNWKRPYQKLQGILEQKENADVFLLKEYLEKHWYKGHSDMSWYDGHNKAINVYTGYWAFETVALVKMFNLDDSTLKGLKYYPSELLNKSHS